jgi:hypothetical protein
MISALFWLLACFFNAVMDACENTPNFNESIFKRLPVQFWVKDQSWKYAPKLWGYKFDAWHIAKSCMILCFLFTALTFDLPLEKWQDWALYIAVAGILWNGGFWLFYHKLFKIR